MTEWFDGAQVAQTLRDSSSSGAGDLAPSNCDMYAQAAIELVEELTGFRPFLAYGSTTRLYDPPRMVRGESYLLDLQTGFVEVSSVEVGLSNGTGYSLMRDSDYWLLPENAASRNRPYTWLRVATSPYGNPQSVRVTGVVGAVRAIPASIYHAALMYACALATESRTPTTGLARVRQGPVEFEYRDDATPTMAARRAVEVACRPYRRG
jgi:hypothetical protein